MQTFTGTTVAAGAAADLNDPAQGSFTNAILLPHLKTALRALATEFLMRGISYTRVEKLNPGVTIAASPTAIVVRTQANLETDFPGFISPIEFFEMAASESATAFDKWRAMRQVDYLPNRVPLDYFNEWAFTGNALELPGCTQSIRLKARYLRDLTIISAIGDVIDIPGSFLYLQKKTAALAAMYIGENESRAQVLAIEAAGELEKCITINLRSDQGIPAVRKPWRGKSNARNSYRSS